METPWNKPIYIVFRCDSDLSILIHGTNISCGQLVKYMNNNGKLDKHVLKDWFKGNLQEIWA